MAGALTLASYPFDPVRIACRRCERLGQYRRTALIALHGGKARLPDVLAQLANDCPMRETIGNEACGPYFPDLVERPRGWPSGGDASAHTGASPAEGRTARQLRATRMRLVVELASLRPGRPTWPISIGRA